MDATPPRAAWRRAWHALLGRVDESLHVRLVSSYLALALVVVGFVALAAFLRARATLRATLLDQLQAVALVKEGEVNRWIDDQREDLSFVADVRELREGAARLAAAPPDGPGDRAPLADLTRLLDSARARALDMDEVFLLSAVGGRVIATTDPERLGEYRVADLFFVRGMERVFVQNVYTSPVTGRPTMTVAAPVRDARGAVVAVLAGHLNLSHMDAILAERTGLGATGEAYLVTELSDFVSAQRFGRPDARRGVHTRGVREALAGRNGAGLYPNYAGARVLGAYRWNAPRQLALLVEMHAHEAFDPARQLVWTILFIGVASAVALAAGVNLIARRVAQPILDVADAAARVAGGDFEVAAPVTTRDEVGRLARSFNDMTARLRGLYDGLNRQIDATRRAYRAMEESQSLLLAVVDNTTNVILALDRDGRLLLVNRRAELLFAVQRAEARGRTPAETLPADVAAAVEAAARAALGGLAVVERDVDLRLEGATHHYHLVGFALAEPGQAPFGAGIVGVDLTERVRAEEEHRRLEAGVQQAQKLESLGLLAGGIAHDFNNILTAIVGGTSLALDDLGEDHPARPDLEQVVVAAERAAKLTRQMLAYAGRSSFALESFDLNSVIREMAELIAVSVPKSVRLAQDLAPDLPPVWADRTQVSQVVLNLVTNAAEATAARGGLVLVHTRKRARMALPLREYRFPPSDAAGFVELMVEDDGAGMSAETMERMFDPFYSTKGSGRGLGLAAVLGIVRRAGGTLKVASRPGEGTTFTVLFPTGAGTVATVAAPLEPRALAHGSGTVLVVDDEEPVRRLAQRTLERAGYTVLEAADGREAMAVFQREGERIAAVVLDVTMPVMGGAEAYRRMRDLGPPVPVIVSSGYDEQDTAAEFVGGGVEFLQKPYRPEQLLALLRELVAARTPSP